MSKHIGRAATVGGVTRRVVPGDAGATVVHPGEAVGANPQGAVLAATGTEAKLVDGVGRAAAVGVVRLEARLDHVQAAEALLDGPLAPGREHELAHGAHGLGLVDYHLNLAAGPDVVWVPEEGDHPVEVGPPVGDAAVLLGQENATAVVAVPPLGPCLVGPVEHEGNVGLTVVQDRFEDLRHHWPPEPVVVVGYAVESARDLAR